MISMISFEEEASCQWFGKTVADWPVNAPKNTWG
jgi:hypothetical protein